MNASPRLLFLIPYFGRWPFWMPFFLRGCGGNPDIDWLFFTDCGVPEQAPANVRFETLAFDAYCEHVSDRLGIAFTPDSPYKLCDLKPALGYIHADRLASYDYWGFSDIDLIYGDLRGYLSALQLQRYELVSTHVRRVSGHLCMMRNSARMREAFMQVDGWREALASPTHNAFDEAAFSRLFVRYKNRPAALRWLLDRLNPWRRQSLFQEAFSTPGGRIPWHDGSFDFPSKWVWREGLLTNDRDGDRSFPYFHFIAWKCDRWPAHAEPVLCGPAGLAERASWCVTAEGFREE